jgi:hypothetical protein
MSKPGAMGDMLANKYGKQDLKFMTGAFICEQNTPAEKKKTGLNNKYTLSVTFTQGEGNMTTHMAETHNLDEYLETLTTKTITPDELDALKRLCSFLVVRIKGQNYQKHCMGLYDEDMRNLIVEQKSRDAIFQIYTSSSSYVYTKINIFLALDANLDKWDKYHEIFYYEYIRKLKCCIGWQQPKYSDIVYRGATMSALELYTYYFKKKFYIPSFVSTSLKKEVALRAPFKGNVLFEIDLSEFNQFTTMIQEQQSKFDEDECLLSCYNVFEFKGVTLQKFEGQDIVVMKLTLKDYEKCNDIENHSIIGATHGDIPTKFLKSGSEFLKNRDVTATKLYEIYVDICKL